MRDYMQERCYANSLKRKRNVRAIPKKATRNDTPSKWDTFTTQPRAAEDSMQTWKMEAPFTITKPVMAAPTNPNTISATIPSVPNPPIPVTSQNRSTYCVMYTALHRPCPTFSPPTVSQPHSDWSDSEEEEDWDGTRQKRRNKEKRNRKKIIKKKTRT